MDKMSIALEVVTALGERDPKKLFSHLDEGIIVEHPARPEGKIMGVEPLSKLMDTFFQWAEEGRVELKRTALALDTAWIERVDHWKIEGKWVAVPVVGIFTFRGEKICRWVEYLDFGYMQAFKTRPGDTLHKD